MLRVYASMNEQTASTVKPPVSEIADNAALAESLPGAARAAGSSFRNLSSSAAKSDPLDSTSMPSKLSVSSTSASVQSRGRHVLPRLTYTSYDFTN